MQARLTIQQFAQAFESLVDLPITSQNQWFDQNAIHPEDSAQLRKMLLADRGHSPGFLDEPASAHVAAIKSGDNQVHDQDIEPSSLIGQRFGAFILTKLLGQGGMATVFLAKRIDADFDQVVAVKLLRRGLFSSVEQQLFRRERRVLAQLNHPNIARLIDGGVSTAGIPFLVMEYVEGLRLDDFVKSKSLNLNERLILFVKACRAVEAAHQALIVHRDIKPSNILVTEEGNPKLLDFGIAKMLPEDDSDSPFRTMTAALTPGYAAPEQMKGKAVTTSTDVYALGVVLHELLVGKLPNSETFARASDQIEFGAKNAAGSLPEPADKLKKKLRGDLDNILFRALHPEPSHRYSSATALIDDIENFLAGKPVNALPVTSWYQIKKFIGRHRFIVSTVSVMSGLLLIAFGIALFQAKAARLEAHRANQVRDFLISIFSTANATQARELRPTPEQIVEQGAERALADQAMDIPTKIEFLTVLANVSLNMGATSQADQITKSLLIMTEKTISPQNPIWQRAQFLRARVFIDQAKYEEAVSLLEPMKTILNKRADNESIEILLALANAKAQTGNDPETQLQTLNSIYALAMKHASTDPQSVLRCLVAESDYLSSIHRYAEAIEKSQNAIAFWHAHGEPQGEEILWLYQTIGNSASSLGDAKVGESAYRKAIELAERIYRRPHQNTAWFVGLLGSYLISLNRLEEAEPFVLRGLQMRRDLLGTAHPQTLFAYAAAARLRAAQNRPDQAITILDEAISGCEKTKAIDEACVRIWQTRGRLKVGMNNYSEAFSDLQRAVDMQKQLTGDNSPLIASQWVYMAELERERGNQSVAIELANRALDIFTRAGGGHFAEVATAKLQLAWSMLDQGNANAAFDLVTTAEIDFAKQAPDNVATRSRMLFVKASAAEKLGRTQIAKQTAKLSLDLLALKPGANSKFKPELQRLAALGAQD